MNTLRRGLSDTVSDVARNGVMQFSSGKATDAPTPRREVPRPICQEPVLCEEMSHIVCLFEWEIRRSPLGLDRLCNLSLQSGPCFESLFYVCT